MNQAHKVLTEIKQNNQAYENILNQEKRSETEEMKLLKLQIAEERRKLALERSKHQENRSKLSKHSQLTHTKSQKKDKAKQIVDQVHLAINDLQNRINSNEKSQIRAKQEFADTMNRMKELVDRENLKLAKEKATHSGH